MFDMNRPLNSVVLLFFADLFISVIELCDTLCMLDIDDD